MKISVIINQLILDDDMMHMAQRNYDSIAENTGNAVELVFVDNNSDAKYKTWFSKCCNTLIQNSTNVGNPMGWDLGIKASGGDIIILMNNDVLVRKNWDMEMVDKLSDKSVGITFPYSIVGDELDHELSGIDVVYRARKDGFLFAFRRETYNQFGPFLDDQPFKLGYYEEDWFGYKVQKSGLRLVPCPNSLAWHKGQGTTKKLWNDEISKGIDANKAWYEKKTGGMYPILEK